jgi:hypothetical protein
VVVYASRLKLQGAPANEAGDGERCEEGEITMREKCASCGRRRYVGPTRSQNDNKEAPKSLRKSKLSEVESSKSTRPASSVLPTSMAVLFQVVGPYLLSIRILIICLDQRCT